LATYESTVGSDTAQLAVPVRGADAEFSVTEEMLGIQPMKEKYLSKNKTLNCKLF
jgi:hypothetical protein